MEADRFPPNYVRKQIATTVKATNEGRREILHTITTSREDRTGDIVQPTGAEVGNFMRNPVVLVDHDYRTEKIIGRATHIEVSDTGISARTQFRDTPLGRDAFALAKSGIGGWSVGFRPIEFDTLRDEKGVFKGFDFTRWELLEYSQVAIPMNPDAVNVAKGLVSDLAHLPLFLKDTGPRSPSVEAPPKANAERPRSERQIRAARDSALLIERHNALTDVRSILAKVE